ncbi:hypothetical protein GCM10022268_32650 [Sphingomonas cynarae]|uniref:Pilus assembly protein Flp/PilA n=1 Tax=Sphingomonas cynarae TaxID=930197 RepID=A0ABP7EPA0_9SPHN
MPAIMTLIRLFSRLMRPMLADGRGATAVEYGLILALVVLAMIGALGNFGRGSTSMWANVSERVVNAR